MHDTYEEFLRAKEKSEAALDYALEGIDQFERVYEKVFAGYRFKTARSLYLSYSRKLDAMFLEKLKGNRPKDCKEYDEVQDKFNRALELLRRSKRTHKDDDPFIPSESCFYSEKEMVAISEALCAGKPHPISDERRKECSDWLKTKKKEEKKKHEDKFDSKLRALGVKLQGIEEVDQT